MSETNNKPAGQASTEKRGGTMGGPGGGGPMGAMARAPAQKAKDFSGTLKRLVKYLAPQKVKFIIVFILAIGSTVFSIIGPKIMGMATTKLGDGIIAQYYHIGKLQYAMNNNLPADTIQQIQNEPVALFDLKYIATILIFLLCLYLFSSFLSFLMSYIMSDVAQNTVFTMRADVKDKLDRLPLKYYDARTHGEILSRVTNDMDTVSTTLQQSLTQLITSFATIIGILVMMLSISPLMTLIALVTLPLSVVCTAFIAKNSQKYYIGQQRAIGELNGHVEEMYSGHKAVKVFGKEDKTVGKFKEINERYYAVGWKAQFFSGLIMPALGFISNIGYVLVCIVGGVLVSSRSITVGDVQAFIQYMRSFTQPIMQTANIANIIQSTIAAAERVFEILDEQEQVPETETPTELTEIEGDVSFDHVAFGYKDDDLLMKDITIDVKAGSTIAIVGPTGAGKTTMINLLMRFYELNGGRITIDGVDITDFSRSDLRSIFGIVLQDTWLFTGTIFDNIKYGREGATDDEVYEAAIASHADHFIRGLPDGYMTVLNEEASNISQGQKQLLTIARAVLSDPSILILDEATSNVDTRTEVLIQKAMDSLMVGRTSFVIAHRLSTIKNADKILVMNKGTIIEQGSHAELLATGGFYSDLYNSQFSEEAE